MRFRADFMSFWKLKTQYSALSPFFFSSVAEIKVKNKSKVLFFPPEYFQNLFFLPLSYVLALPFATWKSGDLPQHDLKWVKVPGMTLRLRSRVQPSDYRQTQALELETSTGPQRSCDPILLFTGNPHEQKLPRVGLRVTVPGPEQAGKRRNNITKHTSLSTP